MSYSKYNYKDGNYYVTYDPFGGAIIDKPSDKEESPIEMEYKQFLQKYEDWSIKVTDTAPIQIRATSTNILFYLSTVLSSKKDNTKLPSIPALLALYGDIINYERIPHNGRPGYFYDRNTGNIIEDNKLKQFILKRGRIWNLNNEEGCKNKKVRCIVKEGTNYVQKYLEKQEFDNYLDISYLDANRSIKTLCSVKIKSCEESIKLFGYKNIKSLMVESKESFKITAIHPGFICKKDAKRRNIIEVQNNGKAYKFLLSEVELILPNLDILINSYKKAKDRTIKEDSKAIVIRNKRTRIPLKSEVKVLSLTKVGGKEYAAVEYNKKQHIISKNNLKVI